MNSSRVESLRNRVSGRGHGKLAALIRHARDLGREILVDLRQPGVVVRAIADAVLLNLGLAGGLLLWFFLGLGLRDFSLAGQGRDYALVYLESFWWFTPIALVTFYACGFYTRIRSYPLRFKLLRIFEGVSAAFLLYVAGHYFGGYLYAGSLATMPRGAMLSAWGVTLAIFVLSRVWSRIWKYATLQETRADLLDEQDGPSAVDANSGRERVLVIGGGGYIGSALIPRLLDDGYDVRVMDRMIYGQEPLAHCMDHPNLELMQVDYRRVDELVRAMEGASAVVHLGGLVGDPACAVNEELTIDVNVTFSRVIAEMAKGCGIRRFVFASSCSVYGASDAIVDERSKLNPVSLYAQTKIASERMLKELSDDRFHPTILRFGTIYGISGRERFDLVVNLLSAKAVVDGEFAIFGSDQWRPFVHVSDAALSIYKSVAAPESLVSDQVFNVGSNAQNLTLGQVGETVLRHVPEARAVYQEREGDQRNYRVDFRKIRRMLGFTPEWTLDDGIGQVVEAVRSGRVQDYRDIHYSNVRVLEEVLDSDFTETIRQRDVRLGDVS